MGLTVYRRKVAQTETWAVRQFGCKYRKSSNCITDYTYIKNNVGSMRYELEIGSLQDSY